MPDSQQDTTAPGVALIGFGEAISIVVGLSDQTWPLVAFALTCVPLYGLFLAQAASRYAPRHAASPGALGVRA